MANKEGMERKTYCTHCRRNVSITDAVYISLATKRAIIRGKCSMCGSELIKVSLMPKSSAMIFRKKRKSKRGLPTI